MNLYKKCTAKPFSLVLLILLLNQIILYVLESDDKIKDEKCNMILIGRQQKYWHYLSKLIPSDQSERIKQAKVTYYHLGKTIEKDKRSRRKTNEDT